MITKQLIFILAVTILTAVGTAFAASEGDTQALYVTVRSTTLRSQPEFLGPVLLPLKYGDRLDQVEDGTAWIRVKAPAGKVGYIHRSAISARKVVLNPSASFGDRSTEAGDVVLAGKGFSATVEKEYSRNNSNLNFRAVDAMEKQRVSTKDLAAFLRAGNLKTNG